MKKIFFLVMLLGIVCTVKAQDVIVYKTQSWPGTNVPPYIMTSFEKAYPGVTIIAWEPVQAYWRASYNWDNRIIYAFYDERGVNYRASLPVIQNSVPEDVISTALKVYGPVVYAIAKMKAANGTEVYKIRLMENGTTKVVWMNADGTAATDVFRAKTDAVVVNPVSQ